MKSACPACGAALSFVRNAQLRFPCPSCGTTLKSNAPTPMLAAIGLTFVLAVPLFLIFKSHDTLGSFYLMLLAELAIALVLYAALGRRYYCVTSEENSG